MWRDDTSAVQHVWFLLRCNCSHIKYSCSLCRSPPFIHINITASVQQEMLSVHTRVLFVPELAQGIRQISSFSVPPGTTEAPTSSTESLFWMKTSNLKNYLWGIYSKKHLIVFICIWLHFLKFVFLFLIKHFRTYGICSPLI